MPRRVVRIILGGLVLCALGAAAVYARRSSDHATLKIAYMDAAGEAEGRGDWSAAATAYRKALAVDRRYLPARTGLAEMYSQQGREDLVLREYRRGVAADPRNPDAHLAVARWHIEHRRYASAAAALKQAIRLVPRETFPRVLLVHAYRWNGQFAQARDQLAELEKLSPGSPDLRRARMAMERQAQRARDEAASKRNQAPPTAAR